MEKTALIFSGYCRNNSIFSPSHQVFIQNSNIDLHIHTWTDQGIRSECSFLQTNSNMLSNLYRPSTMQIDNINNVPVSWSLNSNSDPVFLYNGQKFSDNPPRYLNQYLYSTYIAYSNMCNYENLNGFMYNSIIQIPFDFYVNMFDSNQFNNDIMYNGYSNLESTMCTHSDCNLIFFQGGCRLCNIDKSIQNHVHGHINDLDTTFVYGNRSILGPVFDLYLNSENTYQSFLQSNLVNESNLLQDHLSVSQINTISGSTPFLPPLRYDRNFIYVYNHDPPAEHDIICYHPGRLLREILSSNVCLDGESISGDRIDVLYQPYYKNQ